MDPARRDARLRHALDEQDAGGDRPAGEVAAVEVGVVLGAREAPEGVERRREVALSEGCPCGTLVLDAIAKRE
jgi:hypothetical protein